MTYHFSITANLNKEVGGVCCRKYATRMKRDRARNGIPQNGR